MRPRRRDAAAASTCEPDLTVPDSPGVYAIGDVANIPGPDDGPLPQLGSVALQSGIWAADNILAEFEGKPTKPFAYRDKGIMAMIGRGAAIAAVGKRHHEVHGELAHMAWLGVHASLMTGTRAKIEAFVDWAWDGFTQDRRPARARPDRRGGDRLGRRRRRSRHREPRRHRRGHEPRVARQCRVLRRSG